MMIELVGVHFAHARGPGLLTSIDLVVAAGEVVLVEAPAGAGATTLVRLLLGELTARGRVAVAGREVARLRSSSRAALLRRLGVVPQELGLVGRDTAQANVALALEVCGVGRAARAAQARALLAAVDVEPALAVDRLAMAARQRVAWARAFVRSPDALIADQPTCHQDADGAARFAELLAERAALGAACLVFTRDPHLVAAGARLGWGMRALHAGALVDVVPVIVEPASAPVATPAPVPAAPAAELDLDIPIEIERSAPAAIVRAREAAGTIDLPDIGPAIATPIAPPSAPPSDEDLAAIPNVVPFPRHRSAGNRR
jgi:ABC-type ATPase involved in cell division